MASKTISSGAHAYKTVMEAIGLGDKVDAELFDEATAYARDKKRKRPDAAFRDDAPAKKAAKPAAPKAEKPKATKAEKKPAAKKAHDRKAETCAEDGCPGEHYAKGFCSKHYAAWRRQDPAVRAATNEASARYRASKKASA